MKNIFARKKAKTHDGSDETPISDRIGTVKKCVPSPTAEGKPEEEKVYITTVEIDGTEYTTAYHGYFKEGQKVVVTTVGNIAVINPYKSEKLKTEEE